MCERESVCVFVCVCNTGNMLESTCVRERESVCVIQETLESACVKERVCVCNTGNMLVHV